MRKNWKMLLKKFHMFQDPLRFTELKWEALWISPHQTLPLEEVAKTFQTFQSLGVLLFLMSHRNAREWQAT